MTAFGSDGELGGGDTKRQVLLVGSMPYANEATAMARAVELVGDRLLALPDGEIGERSEQYPDGDRASWISGLASRFLAEGDLFDMVDPGTMNAQGFPVDYDSMIRLKPKVSGDVIAARVDLGYDTFALRSWPEFEKLRAETGRSDLRFQLGLPTGLAAAVIILGPARALQLSHSLATRLAVEANRVARVVGAENLLFQIEVPIEVIAAHKVPKQMVALPTKTVSDLWRRLDPAVPVGIHCCFGDLNNTSGVTPTEFDRLVDFTNALVKKWPANRRLDYVHLPFAAASTPSPTDPAAYRALGRLALPTGTRLVAGFVHEVPTMESLIALRGVIEGAYGGQVDVACACGLGRREPAVADELLRRCRELAID